MGKGGETCWTVVCVSALAFELSPFSINVLSVSSIALLRLSRVLEAREKWWDQIKQGHSLDSLMRRKKKTFNSFQSIMTRIPTVIDFYQLQVRDELCLWTIVAVTFSCVLANTVEPWSYGTKYCIENFFCVCGIASLQQIREPLTLILLL